MPRLFPWLFIAWTTPALAETLALTGGAVWTGPAAQPIRNGTVVIENGRISAVGRLRAPRGATVIDCTGMTVLAGFWNSHVHFFERKWANGGTIPAPELERQLEEMTTRFGFTSVFDIGSPGENTRRIRQRIEKGEVRGPAIRATGEVIVAPGAVPPANVLRMLGNLPSENHEVNSAEEATAAVRSLVASGADGIKLHLQLPLPEDVIQAVANEARKAGKPVFVHPSSRADVMAAARAGVDVLAHTTPFAQWDGAVVRALLEKRVAITPTLSMWRFLLRHDRVTMQEKAAAEAVAQLNAWHAAGGTVLFGSDLGAVEYDPAEEYERMARAGMRFAKILASLTQAPAERFGEAAERGQIAPGFAADLTIVAGDPATNLRALTAVRYTIRNGRVIFRGKP